MKSNKFINLIILSFIFLIVLIIPISKIFSQEYDPDFKKEELISDFQMFDYTSMSQSQVQQFLESKNSYLATYNVEDYQGIVKPASQIIYEASQQYKVNPKYVIVMLQKEQGLIQMENPTQKRLDWACGYAVCDGCSLSDPKVLKFKGFGKQVDNAAGAMKFYTDKASTYEFIKKAGKSYEINGEIVIPKNQATANLYTYTPHIAGNYTFWRVWQRYFGDPNITKRDGNASISTDYMVQLINSSGSELNIKEGDKSVVWVEYLNIGTKEWINSDLKNLYLVDAKYKSSIPMISKTSTYSVDDEMKKNIKVYSQRASVKPGEVLRVSIPIDANYDKTESGSYMLVLGNKGWFADSDINYNIIRTFRYDAQYLDGLPDIAEAGENNTFIIKYKNVGLMPWYKTDTKLQWISSSKTNYAILNQTRVMPGEIGSFTITSKINDIGEHAYELSLWKQINASKMNKFPTGDIKTNTNISVSYAAKLLYESVPTEMSAGQEKIVKIKVRNVGSKSWDDNLVLRSYSKISPFSASSFFGSDWISNMAISKVNKVVKPGDVYMFTFNIKAPKILGTYKQYYQLEWGSKYEEIYIDSVKTKVFETKVIK
ncbi:MAG: hypothetical protein PHZ07_05065 [Patescibacteria group bacterium]|nr:hypothetical protein [Patescibacteria group bacterium]MDD4304750.1 hypothetical protein [Patescibacteria group bacterium]MDD4695761.1 hypothetical protein [Patescibacteria group bacterium]